MAIDTDKGGGEFAPTLWSVVLAARDPDDPRRRSAMNRLCETYWKPVYVYLRKKGRSIEDSKDATQAFFAHFIEKELVERVEKGRGRFKNYLLAVLENFLANEYRKGHAAKRGGGKTPLSLDLDRAETEIPFTPADTDTPEDAFRRSWGLTVLQNAFEKLRKEFEDRGLMGHFEAVRAHLAAAGDRPSYEDLAARLDSTVTDVTNLLHRSRKRLKEIIRSTLRETVQSEADVESELRDLFEAL